MVSVLICSSVLHHGCCMPLHVIDWKDGGYINFTPFNLLHHLERGKRLKTHLRPDEILSLLHPEEIAPSGRWEVGGYDSSPQNWHPARKTLCPLVWLTVSGADESHL